MKPQSNILPNLAVLAGIAFAAPAARATETLILSDNFDTANGTTLAAVNANLDVRQSGTLAPSSYAYYYGPGSTGVSISSNQLLVGSNRGFFNNADFKPALSDPEITGFKLSFKFASTGTDWVSPFLSTHPDSDDRGATEFGLLVYADGAVQAYATGPDKAASSAAINTALGGTWNRSAQNTYELAATPATTTTGTYDVSINGFEVISDVPYSFGSGGSNGQINFEVRTISNGVGLFDDLQITTVSPTPPPFDLTIAPNGANFDFSWDSQPGKAYDLLASTDPATPVAEWPIYNDGATLYENIPATGTTTTLMAVPSSGPRRFFAMREEDGPPLLAADFEDNNGGFTSAKTAGSDWEWGSPTSADNGGTPNLGGSVTAGNNGSTKCWGTNIGNPGYYADPTTDSCLISPVIDLSAVAGAELSFAHAIDTAGGDPAVLRIVNANTDAVIDTMPFADGNPNSATWQTTGPIALPVGTPIRLKWCLTGDGGDSDDYMGWYIDDVRVVETTP
jgi:hypothetical protein